MIRGASPLFSSSISLEQFHCLLALSASHLLVSCFSKPQSEINSGREHSQGYVYTYRTKSIYRTLEIGHGSDGLAVHPMLTYDRPRIK